MPFSTVILLLCAFVMLCGCATRANARGESTGLAVTCEPGADTDRDRLSDACEASFAHAFAPLLRTAPDPCADQPDALPPGGYLFGVQPLAPDSLRIVYLPAYHEDCGWRGFKCSLGLTSCRGHSGDSELIALDVARRSQRWETVAVFLSAHCFGRSDANCRWYAGAALGAFAWLGSPRSAPVVWVADGKHANYPSRSSCDAGHWFYDTCDRNTGAVRFPVVPARNVGSSAVPISGDGCISGAELDGREKSISIPARNRRASDATAVECFWSGVAFTGWQRPPQGSATPYQRYLRMLFEDGP